MQIHITARNTRLTAAIRNYVEEKFQKAQRHFSHIIWAQAVLSVEKRSHQAEMVVHASRQTFRALAKGVDLYSAIDLASDKIDAQLKKYKDRLKDRHKAGPGDPAELLAVASEGPLRFSVIKQVPVRPMTREEAADEMDRLGFTFWLFLDRTSNQVNLIYRRTDESYGLLQPARRDGK